MPHSYSRAALFAVLFAAGCGDDPTLPGDGASPDASLRDSARGDGAFSDTMLRDQRIADGATPSDQRITDGAIPPDQRITDGAIPGDLATDATPKPDGAKADVEPDTLLPPDGPANQYTVGGTITGLAGTGLILQNSEGDDLPITANGSFTFATKVPSGESYNVTVLKQPTSPSQACTITSASGIIGSANVGSVAVVCTTNKYSVGGTVSGLLGSGLVLQNNAGDDLAVLTDGRFAFSTPLASSTAYAVTVKTQPGSPAQTCLVASGTGTVSSAHVTNVAVTCAAPSSHTIGGTVSGLAGTGLLLKNGGDQLPITANGSFTFPTKVASGAPYLVTVGAQPVSPTQVCSVSNGSGMVGTANVTSVSVVCSTSSYTIGGTVSGLAGTGLLLKNGGEQLPISTNGSFTFATKVASGAAYLVTVGAQPASPTQVCSVSNGSGTVGSANVTSVSVTCTTSQYTVGGTVSGLLGSGLVLRNNGGDNLPIAANGTFTFATKVASGAAYAVTVGTQPAGPAQVCSVSSGSGVMGSGNVTNVSVVCSTSSYTIGGTVSGLSGSGLVLRNNGGDSLSITGNGSFTFATKVASGAGYAVTVATQPTGQLCSVSNGSGTVGSANITNVSVSCVSSYTIGGTVTGLSGSGLVLRNNGGNNLAISANGSFTFTTPLLSGAAYAVTVYTNPTSPWQTCSVTGGSGTVSGANVTSVAVACTTNTYYIGGTVSGLAGSGLVLRNNGGNNLTVTANGSFMFTTPVASGGTYAVTVYTQPSSCTQTCVVTSGSGTVSSANVTNVSVTCTTNTYLVGGTVTGLAGTGLVLRNNGGDNLSISGNGSFVFSTKVASCGTYAVTVYSQPAGPTQTCTVSSGSGTVTSANITSVAISCSTNTYTIGGTVTGLEGGRLALQNNAGNDLPIITDGAFTFTTAIASGGTYSVTVLTQPDDPWQTCVVTNGSGTVGGANVTNVAVTCTTNSYTIGGTVTGLTGSGLVLRNMGGDDLPITANGTFTFATKVLSGSSYNVTVYAQPTGQVCAVTNAVGSPMNQDITDVVVTCGFGVGGTVSGLSSHMVLLQNNGGDSLGVWANGSFTFPTPQVDGASYDVSAFANPVGGKICRVYRGYGAIKHASVTNVQVVCYDYTYHDDFNRTNSSTVTGWTEQVGDWAVSGRRLAVNSGSEDYITYDGSSLADGCITARVTYSASASKGQVGLVARFTDTSNMVYAVVRADSSGQLTSVHIIQVIGGTYSVRHSATGLSLGNDAIIQLSFVGSSLSFRVDTDRDGTFDYIGSGTTTLTSAGRVGAAGTPSATVDDFGASSTCPTALP